MIGLSIGTTCGQKALFVLLWQLSEVKIVRDMTAYSRWPKVTPTHQQYGIVARQRTSIGFKLAVRGDSGAGGLVAPLPCAAYFGKLAILFGCSLPQQA